MEGIDLFVKTLGNGEGRKENFQSLEAPKHPYVTCKWSPTSSWGASAAKQQSERGTLITSDRHLSTLPANLVDSYTHHSHTISK